MRREETWPAERVFKESKELAQYFAGRKTPYTLAIMAMDCLSDYLKDQINFEGVAKRTRQEILHQRLDRAFKRVARHAEKTRLTPIQAKDALQRIVDHAVKLDWIERGSVMASVKGGKK